MLANSNNHFDGAQIFSGASFMPSQSTQAADPSSSKSHGPKSLLPLTVKQIAGSFFSADANSSLFVDGVEASFRVLGLVTNKKERPADVSFSLDDGTSRIEISRWISMASDAAEVAAVQDGMYVQVTGHMKEFQGKRHAFAFSVRPVTDFNEITLHFIECVHVHLENTRLKLLGGAPTQIDTNPIMSIPFTNVGKGYQPPLHSQFLTYSGVDNSENDICQLVLAVFQEPKMLASEHGLHVDEVIRRLRLPRNKIVDAINYLVDVGHIYSTVDEYHFKSANSG